jgi:hypothetical protein
MKTQSVSLLLASVLSIGMLSSCVTPYNSYGETSVTTTSYQPGYRINSLPSGYRTEVISGGNYYYNDGVYYRPESQGYVVVEAPRTSRYYAEYDRHRYSNSYRNQRGANVSVISHLPSGYRVVNHGGNQYYQAGDNYYRREGNGYIVVSSPY